MDIEDHEPREVQSSALNTRYGCRAIWAIDITIHSEGIESSKSLNDFANL